MLIFEYSVYQIQARVNFWYCCGQFTTLQCYISRLNVVLAIFSAWTEALARLRNRLVSHAYLQTTVTQYGRYLTPWKGPGIRNGGQSKEQRTRGKTGGSFCKPGCQVGSPALHAAFAAPGRLASPWSRFLGYLFDPGPHSSGRAVVWAPTQASVPAPRVNTTPP